MMPMKKVGFVGHRGTVGATLLERMRAEGDFSLLRPFFFSSSEEGLKEGGPPEGGGDLKSAYDLGELKKMDMIVTTQGGAYTKKVYSPLRKALWKGIWIDAASTLRQKASSTLVLPPLNQETIKRELSLGKKDFIGPNCTVALLLMALAGLCRHGLIEWVSSMTYQAASGAGAKKMEELIKQMRFLVQKNNSSTQDISEISSLPKDTLKMEREIREKLQGPALPKNFWEAPLACNLLPWIDTPMPEGETYEEWKGTHEAKKILQSVGLPYFPVDGTCVRVPTLRSHAQGLTIKLKKELSLDEIEVMLCEAHEWIRYITNTKEETLKHLSPAGISGTLQIAIGRVRFSHIGEKKKKLYLNLFTVGDQLLWGAAEPLRRTLRLFL